MGLGVSKTMEANLRKQQEFMMEMQRTQVERQIQMQNQMRERQMAFQVARSRELLYWFASFYALAAAGMVLRYRKTRNRTILAPLLPLTFMLGYQTDLAYGNKLMRIRDVFSASPPFFPPLERVLMEFSSRHGPKRPEHFVVRVVETFKKHNTVLIVLLSAIVVFTTFLSWTESSAFVLESPESVASGVSACSRCRTSDEVSKRAEEVTGSVDASREKIETNCRRLPAVIIIGAKKCGTRALLEMMNLHPRVRRTTREVHFFDRDVNYANGLDWYRERMPVSSSGQLTVEKTPGYFVSPEAPLRIRAMSGSMKVVLIVREPVTRLISDYTQVVMSKEDDSEEYRPKFEDMVLDSDGNVDTSYKAVRTSIYAKYFPLWLEHFPKDQIHVVDGERLVVDPLSEMKRVEAFLELEPFITAANFWFSEEKGFFCLRNEGVDKCLGPSKGRKHPDVPEAVRFKLKNYYRSHNAAFARVANVSFPWLFL